MSKSLAQEPICPFGSPCPLQSLEPSAVHPPPEEWLEKAPQWFSAVKELHAQAFAEGAVVVGIYLTSSITESTVIWQDKNGVWTHSVG